MNTDPKEKRTPYTLKLTLRSASYDALIDLTLEVSNYIEPAELLEAVSERLAGLLKPNRDDYADRPVDLLD